MSTESTTGSPPIGCTSAVSVDPIVDPVGRVGAATGIPGRHARRGVIRGGTRIGGGGVGGRFRCCCRLRDRCSGRRRCHGQRSPVSKLVGRARRRLRRCRGQRCAGFKTSAAGAAVKYVATSRGA